MIRPLRADDLPEVRALHERLGAKFDFPEQLETAYVLEEGGKIVGMAGAERCAHVFMVLDPAWGSPHQRMELIESFHWPVSRDLFKKGIQHAFVWIDPQFKRFGHRMRSLGWVNRVWECLSISQTEVAKRLGKQAA